MRKDEYNSIIPKFDDIEDNAVFMISIFNEFLHRIDKGKRVFLEKRNRFRVESLVKCAESILQTVQTSKDILKRMS